MRRNLRIATVVCGAVTTDDKLLDANVAPLELERQDMSRRAAFQRPRTDELAIGIKLAATP